MPADKAGIAPGIRIVGVNGKKFSQNRLRDAIADSVTRRKVEFLVEEGEEFRTVVVPYAEGLRYEDVVAAADVVVTKPGYGIVAECIANDTAMLFTSRGRFVEYDALVAHMPRWLRCRYLERDDLLAGRWHATLRDLLAQPPPPERPRVDGAEVAVEWIGQTVGLGL